MANQNSIADLSTTPASNLNFKGQSIRGTAVANTIDTMFQNEASMLKAFYDSLGGAATVSGTDTYTVTVTEDWAAYASGLVLAIKVPNANTGASTLNVTVPTAGALGAKAIRRQGDSALSANDMVANGVYLLRYSSTYNTTGAWVLMNPAPPSGSLDSLWAKGSNVASATTTSLGAGNFFHITGTTTITDIDFTSALDGRIAWLEFDGALTLTHNGTTLTLPGGANITTAAGDRALIVQDNGDNVHVMFYQRAGSTPDALNYGSKVATTSGTTADLSTAIPAWARQITIHLVGVSTNNTGSLLVQVGSGSFSTSGYVGAGTVAANGSSGVGANSTAGFLSFRNSAANLSYGTIVLTLADAATNTWVASGAVALSDTPAAGVTGGSIALAGALDRVRLNTTDGATFDAGFAVATWK